MILHDYGDVRVAFDCKVPHNFFYENPADLEAAMKHRPRTEERDANPTNARLYEKAFEPEVADAPHKPQ